MTKHKFTSNDGIHINVVELKYMQLNIKKNIVESFFTLYLSVNMAVIQPKYAILRAEQYILNYF